ncbi:hypothetical protein GGR42_002022 [Saonia flava]|uniref:Lipocalin-like domain-containing protein n=1 Tax=Saonia flava TaxID=523696 RepID=A0A846QXA0_9FLAO|nr:hypothetical protein [Saonia flava]NJB71560.1 hypothetical protein [Saonia flava]
MKNVLNCLTLLLVLSSCSKIDVNSDPILGIWSHNVKSGSTAITDKVVIDSHEWIFNDAYLGRFHAYNDGEVVFLTDFKWTVEGEIYTLSYPGTDLQANQLKMIVNEEGDQLVKLSGSTFAIKQN